MRAFAGWPIPRVFTAWTRLTSLNSGSVVRRGTASGIGWNGGVSWVGEGVVAGSALRAGSFTGWLIHGGSSNSRTGWVWPVCARR
eukprot:694691-Pelagomonas_calceolata.AAC.1